MEIEEEDQRRGHASMRPPQSRAVIFYSPGDAYRVGNLLPYDPSSDTAQVQDAENRQMYTVRVSQDVHEMSAPLPLAEESEDLLLLQEATQGHLLCTLRLRYQDERYYTSIGRESMLLVNPPQPEPPLAVAPHMYLQDRPNLPPHPWMLASRALQHVAAGNDAVIILSGDQGSGKTGAAREVMRLLHTLLPPGAGGGCSVITVKIAKEIANDDFAEAVSRHLSIPKAAVNVLSAMPVQVQNDAGTMDLTEVTFRFQDIGQDGERLAKDFRTSSNIISQSVARELSIVASSVEESKVWPSGAVGTLVDAFCNARTTRNVDSTRATVLTRYAIKDNHVIGCEVRSYLLELSRAQGPPQGERTFHIFYYLMAGASDWERDRYHLPLREDFEDAAFAILGKVRSNADSSAARSPWEQSMAALHSMGSCGDWVTSLEELVAGYDELVDAFDACRVSHRVQDWIFRVLSAILHLGQLSFAQEQSGGVTTVAHEARDSLQHVADCLQLNAHTLEASLTTHIQSVLNERVDIRLTPPQAQSARDSLIRSLYEKVVDVTFATINSQLAPVEDVTGWLCTLDFMGTEDGAHNDLGALATNYANEVLQNYYNKVVFDEDVSDCVEELGGDCDVSVVDYPEVYSVVKLLRANLGIFSIIDDESSQPHPSDAALLEALSRRLGSHAKFERRPISINCFTVKHSCGDIEYNAAKMTTTNRNAVLPQDVRRCLAASLCKYTAEAFLSPQELKERQALESEHEKGQGAGGVPADFAAISARLQLLKHQPAKPTYLSRVKHQVFALMSLVEESKPFFIRCLRPAKGIATAGAVFHGRHVIKQLDALSVLSTLKQKQMSYAFRQSFDALLRGLWMLTKELPAGGDDRHRVQTLLDTHAVDRSLYRLGKTKAFLSKRAYSTLRERQRAQEKALGEVVQAFCRARFAVTQVQVMRGDVARAEQEHRQLQSNVQQKKEWEAARERREVDDVTRLVHDETRVRRNVDNQEAVGYITIMTGLIEGVERAKQQWTQRRAREEKEKEHRLESLLREERAKEERCASEMLSQRMLAQGGKLDRILAKKFSEEQRLKEKRSRQESTQQRLLKNRMREERKRLDIEKKILAKEDKREMFTEHRNVERELVEKRRTEQEELDKHAREARFRARQVWEEAKRDEYDLEQIEREVVLRVERELAESKKRQGFTEKLESERELRIGQARIAHIEKVRASKQLQRERKEHDATFRANEEKRKRELEQWKSQQHQRMLDDELSKIKDTQERKRFARRQKEKQALSVPKVYNQLVEPAMSKLGSPYPSVARSARSMTPSSLRQAPAYQPLAPPSPFVTSTGATINAPTLGPQKKKNIRAYQESVHRRTASKSPSRMPASPMSSSRY